MDSNVYLFQTPVTLLRYSKHFLKLLCVEAQRDRKSIVLSFWWKKNEDEPERIVCCFVEWRCHFHSTHRSHTSVCPLKTRMQVRKANGKKKTTKNPPKPKPPYRRLANTLTKENLTCYLLLGFKELVWKCSTFGKINNTQSSVVWKPFIKPWLLWWRTPQSLSLGVRLKLAGAENLKRKIYNLISPSHTPQTCYCCKHMFQIKLSKWLLFLRVESWSWKFKFEWVVLPMDHRILKCS